EFQAYGTQGRSHKGGDRVLDGGVRFLEVARVFGGDSHRDVGARAELAAICTRQRDGPEPEPFGCVDGPKDVLGVPARADREEGVAGAAERLHLTFEDAVEPEVVSDRGEDRGVGRERDGG